MTLTIELVQDIIKVNPCTKYHDHISNGSAVRALTYRHTHTQTDQTVSITSTAYVGGKNVHIVMQCMVQCTVQCMAKTFPM